MKRRREKTNTSSSASAVTVSSGLVKRESLSVLSPNMVMLVVIPAVALGVYAVLVNIWESQTVYMLINEPLDLPLIMEEWDGAHLGEKLWSSYTSDVYIGIQSTIPRSVTVGLAWFVQRGGNDGIHLHHTCIDGGGSPECLPFQWTKHDGRSFGQQIIRSIEGYIVKSEFISDSQPGSGDTWTLRVTAEPLKKMQKSFLSLIVYVHNKGQGQMDLTGDVNKGMIEEIFGHTPEMNEYRVHFPYKFLTKTTAFNFIRTHVPSEREENITNVLMESMVSSPSTDKLPRLLTFSNDMTKPLKDINFIAYQITSLLIMPIEMDTVFESGMYSAALSVSGKRFTEVSHLKHASFDQRFEEKFKLLSKGFNMEDVIMCKVVLSNLLGSIKYGHNSDMSVKKGEIVSSKRYFSFPFLSSSTHSSVDSTEYSAINEGYHQLVVLQWNTNITKAVIGHWLDAMNIDGWIPGRWWWHKRSDNIGQEEEDTEYAYTPSFFLTIDSLITQMEKNKEIDYQYLQLILLRLEVWFDWLNETQAGPLPGTYKWRPRETSSHILNPKTPTSGMWDYPRSSDPSHYMEYHLDLRCWMTIGAKLLTRITQLLGIEDSSYYMNLYKDLANVKRFDQLHWDNKRKVYSDYGLHNPNVKRVKAKSGREFVKKVTGESSLRYVGNLGYVSLFPLMLMILSPDSSKLGYSLKQLQDSMLLWSPYGIRSLAKNDYLYHKSNVLDDRVVGGKDSYEWRGPVHIHFNYLLLRALSHYSHSPGPYAGIANKTYTELRKNLISTVVKEYSRTGFIWSHYNDKNGQGVGSRNSGLSSLILLVMAEIF